MTKPKIYDTKAHKPWTHGEAFEGETRLGPCPHCGKPTVMVGTTAWLCSVEKCRNGILKHPPQPLALTAPVWWNGLITVFKDEYGAWNCKHDTITEALGIGTTPADAFVALNRDIIKFTASKNITTVTQEIIVTIQDISNGSINIDVKENPPLPQDPEIPSKAAALAIRFFDWLKEDSRQQMEKKTQENQG